MFHIWSYFLIVLSFLVIFIFSSVHCTVDEQKKHHQHQENFDRTTTAFSPKFELHHRRHKHRLRRAVIKICVDFNRQPIPCKWEMELNHGHRKHRLRRAVIKICVDFNRQPIPCKWETEAQLRKKLMACHLSIITMPFCHRTVPKITRKMHKIQRNRRIGGIFEL
ncbi:hypothetical protein niasHS_016541 [Heterodera schachtii]|uniref:Uncharacterized protein n=2 Tax=Heterodera TaxID=34509 RepID=A0ABD2HP47_HETSC